MNKEVKKMWITALTSGAYQQGSEFLKREMPVLGTRHCCLGVLCELYSKDTGVPWDNEHENADDTEFAIHGESALLPQPVVDWAGLQDDCGRFGPKDSQDALTQINDSGKHDFNDIAEIIREHF